MQSGRTEHPQTIWVDVVDQHAPGLSPVVAVCFANVCSLLLEDLSNCPALVLVGQPSTGKTTALDFFVSDGIIYPCDNFTPASFVSHAANVKREGLEKIDLLPQIRHKVLKTPDLAPMFNKRKEDLDQIIGILTRVLDGRGFWSQSGTHGRRGYEGDYRFGLLAASTPLTKHAWDAMSRLGPRLLFYDVEMPPETEEQKMAKLTSSMSYWDKVQACQQAVSEALEAIWNDNGGFGGLEWDKEDDDPELVLGIIRLAALGAALRGRVARENNVGLDDDSYNYSPAIVEGPDRFQSMLYNLARGNAIANGRRNIADSDLSLVARVALSSGPDERKRILRAALSQTAGVTVVQAKQLMHTSDPTARKALRDMSQLGILKSEAGANPAAFRLSEEHAWLRKYSDAV